MNKYYKKYSWMIVLTTIVALITKFSMLPYPFIFKDIIDKTIPGHNFNELFFYSAILIGLVALRSIGIFLQSYMLAILESKVEVDLKEEVFKKTVRLEMNEFYSRETGKYTSLIASDCTNSVGFFRDYYLVLIESAVFIVVAVALMLSQSIILTAVSAVIIPFLLISSRKFNSKMAKESMKLSDASMGFFGELNESLHSVEEIKLNNLYDKSEATLIGKLKNYTRIMVNINKYGALAGSVLTFITSLGPILILITGTYLSLNNNITIGTIVAFTSLIAYLYEPAQRIMTAGINVQRPKTISKKILEYLALPEENLENKNHTINKVNKLEFKDVSFSYKNEKIFNKINFQVNSGEIIGLKGKSGIGKSTIFKLITGLYSVNEGKVVLNGEDIYNYNLKDLRSRIGLLSKNTYIFSGNIKENIDIYETNNVKFAELAEKAHIAKEIDSMKDRYDTIIGSGGQGLSDGQKVRIGMARMLAKNPDIVLIDEAFGSLDTKTEDEVMKSIIDMKKQGKIVIIISHRESSFKFADRIYEINEKREIVHA